MSIALPRFVSAATNRLDEYAEQLSKLTRIAYVYAITSGKIHRVHFLVQDRNRIQIERHTGYSVTGEPVFEPIKQSFVPTTYDVDSLIILKHFFIKGIDEVARGRLQEAWFYIFPIGVAQDILITVEDSERGNELTIALNPFSVKFTIYDDIPQKI